MPIINLEIGYKKYGNKRVQEIRLCENQGLLILFIKQCSYYTIFPHKQNIDIPEGYVWIEGFEDEGMGWEMKVTER